MTDISFRPEWVSNLRHPASVVFGRGLRTWFSNFWRAWARLLLPVYTMMSQCKDWETFPVLLTRCVGIRHTRWIPPRKGRTMWSLGCFISCYDEPILQQTGESPLVWDTKWHHRNGFRISIVYECAYFWYMPVLYWAYNECSFELC